MRNDTDAPFLLYMSNIVMVVTALLDHYNSLLEKLRHAEIIRKSTQRISISLALQSSLEWETLGSCMFTLDSDFVENPPGMSRCSSEISRSSWKPLL